MARPELLGESVVPEMQATEYLGVNGKRKAKSFIHKVRLKASPKEAHDSTITREINMNDNQAE
jgi:hypothetical protein